MDMMHSQLDLYAMEYDGPYSSSLSTPVSASPQKAVIDYSKFKTKLCRNYLMGIACPFESRCAFAHGPEEQQAARAAANACSPTIPSPPSYTAFISASDSMDDLSGSGATSRPNTPPAYPTRFRYEPYSQAGIIFAN